MNAGGALRSTHSARVARFIRFSVSSVAPERWPHFVAEPKKGEKSQWEREETAN